MRLLSNDLNNRVLIINYNGKRENKNNFNEKLINLKFLYFMYNFNIFIFEDFFSYIF